MNKDPEINELSIFLNELHEESDRGIDLTNNLPWLGPGDIEQTVKSRFKFCVTILLTDLLWRNRLVSKEKITPKIWGNTTRKHFSKN
ncbi:hypothetical protein [Proteus mirabilis]